MIDGEHVVVLTDYNPETQEMECHIDHPKKRMTSHAKPIEYHTDKSIHFNNEVYFLKFSTSGVETSIDLSLGINEAEKGERLLLKYREYNGDELIYDFETLN